MTITETAVDTAGASSTRVRTLSICLINPRFEPSYWGFDYALALYPGDKRSTMISGSLPTVAGLCGDHHVTVIDENVEEIDWDSLGAYDIVGVTGMTVQKTRVREILLRLRELNIFTVVGGPFVSVQIDHHAVGQGELPVEKVLRDLLAAGFSGPIVLETLHDSQMTSIARLKALLEELRGGTR